MTIVRIGGGSTAIPSAEIVGAKAANLARMAALGLPVPPAFVLPVDLCAEIVRGKANAMRRLRDGLREGIGFLEETTGKTFGDRRRPLLVSVRSGAARSMPGMLDTVLDIGCTLNAVRGLVRMTGHPRFAWDCRCRLLESYAEIVLGLDAALFTGRQSACPADGETLERLAHTYEHAIEEEDGEVPDDPQEQLEAAAQAVYRSWNGNRAVAYRKLQHLDDLQGTAVTVQAMVFGNRGLASGAGVAFSRDPSMGAKSPVIDVLFDAQGEDVVSGSSTPETEEAIARRTPAVAEQLRDTLALLEREFRDVQDVEFTIEEGILWILQTRSAKRTPLAALRFAIDFANEGLISRSEARSRLNDVDRSALVVRRLINVGEPVAKEMGASAGVAIGRAAFDSESADRMAENGEAVILVRPDTSTEDVDGFAISQGIVTAVGGRTAHAALVARQMGKPCIVGCTALAVDAATRKMTLAGEELREGDWLSIDGGTGEIYLGRGSIATDETESQLAEVERWQA